MLEKCVCILSYILLFFVFLTPNAQASNYASSTLYINGVADSAENKQISGEFCNSGISSLREGFVRTTQNNFTSLGSEIYSGTAGAEKTFAQIYNDYGAGQYLYRSFNAGAPCGLPTSATSWMVFTVYNASTTQIEGVSDFVQTGEGYQINYSSQYDTRFTNLVFSTTTASTSITTAFYIDAEEASSTQADKNPTIVRYRYSKVPSTDVSGYGIAITDSVNPTWGNGTTTASFNLDNSSTYDFTISFANGGTPLTGVTPFPLAYIYFRITTNATGGIESTSTVEFYDAVEEQAFQYQPCSITEISGCITNSLAYVFLPSNESLDQFNTLSSELENRAPFVYVYQVPYYWETLYNTASSHSLSISASTSLGEITFLSAGLIQSVPYSSTIRTIVGYLLWVMLTLTIYARVTKLFNHQEKSV